MVNLIVVKGAWQNAQLDSTLFVSINKYIYKNVGKGAVWLSWWPSACGLVGLQFESWFGWCLGVTPTPLLNLKVLLHAPLRINLKGHFDISKVPNASSSLSGSQANQAKP
jgi:hypothetical protein